VSQGPNIPKEDRSFVDGAGASADDPMRADGRGVEAGADGVADADGRAQGRFGSLRQNRTAHWKVQER
jgi:hypothetical protein